MKQIFSILFLLFNTVNLFSSKITIYTETPQLIECNSCHKTDDLKTCNRCKSVKYCSRECQKGDWKNHKIFCGLPIKKKCFDDDFWLNDTEFNHDAIAWIDYFKSIRNPEQETESYELKLEDIEYAINNYFNI